jgi:hypothetical protein
MSRRASSNSGMTRRAFLRSSGAAAGTAVLAGPLVGLQLQQAVGARPRPERGYGPLLPTRDRTTGLPLLRLRAGSVTSRSAGAATRWTTARRRPIVTTAWRSSRRAAAGAGRSELVLFRNHEGGPALPGDPLPVVGAGRAPVYDGFVFEVPAPHLGTASTGQRQPAPRSQRWCGSAADADATTDHAVPLRLRRHSAPPTDAHTGGRSPSHERHARPATAGPGPAAPAAGDHRTSNGHYGDPRRPPSEWRRQSPQHRRSSPTSTTRHQPPGRVQLVGEAHH